MGSSRYHEISTDYLMGPVACLGKMMTLDEDDDKDEIQRLNVKLNDQSAQANQKIMDMQAKEREDFKNFMHEKMATISGVFNDLIKDIPEEREVAIEEQISSGSAAAAISANDWC